MPRTAPIAGCNGVPLREQRLIYAVSPDVTDLERITEELHAAKDTADSASRARSDFLGNMSHEICTPMNAIIGIPKDKQRVIFDVFAQADTSITRHNGGTGLGPSISVQILALMGGRIWVESVPGDGSTFYFTARFGHSTSAAECKERPDLSQLHGLRVLVADDQRVNRELVQRILEKRGHSARCASNGIEALDALNQEPFDAVLMDVQIPKMDGLAAGRHDGQPQDLDPEACLNATSQGARPENARRPAQIRRRW